MGSWFDVKRGQLAFTTDGEAVQKLLNVYVLRSYRIRTYIFLYEVPL